jgi:hypothetical protein
LSQPHGGDWPLAWLGDLPTRPGLFALLSLTHPESFSQNSNTFALTKIDCNGEKIAF